MLFAHLKRIFRLGRLRLRGPRGAQDEFTLAAIAQNLCRLIKLVARAPPLAAACVARASSSGCVQPPLATEQAAKRSPFNAYAASLLSRQTSATKSVISDQGGQSDSTAFVRLPPIVLQNSTVLCGRGLLVLTVGSCSRLRELRPR